MAQTAATALDVPARLAGRYRVLRPIGQGSIAQVVEAHDEERGATVALKILYPNLFSNQVIADRFRREAQVVRRIEHAHVIRIHDVVAFENGDPERPIVNPVCVFGRHGRELARRLPERRVIASDIAACWM